jgi:transposase
MPRVSSAAMTLHLEEISKAVGPSAHAVLVCDGAGWHRPGGRLRVPENVTLLRLPPYAPELNPMENVWEYLRGNQLSMTVWRTYTAILDACCNAWNSLMRDAERITSITTRDWAQVNV